MKHMHMPHPFGRMKGMHGMHHAKQQKCLSILTLIALGTLIAVNVMHLKEMKMKHKKRGNPVQDKLEHFQRCFERLMEHS